MKQKHKVKPLFFVKPEASSAGKRNVDLAFKNPVKKFAEEENEHKNLILRCHNSKINIFLIDPNNQFLSCYNFVKFLNF